MRPQFKNKPISQSKQTGTFLSDFKSLKQMFCHNKSQQPIFSPSFQIIRDLSQLQIQAKQYKATFIYNISQLVCWAYLQLGRIFNKINIEEPSLDVTIFIMKLVEILTIYRFLQAVSVKNQSKNLQKLIVKLIEQRKIQTGLLAQKIKLRHIRQQHYSLISQKQTNFAYKIISQYEQFSQNMKLKYKNGQVNKDLKQQEGNLQIVFKSILRNLGRKIQAHIQETKDSSQMMLFFLKLFYLMIGFDNELKGVIYEIKNNLVHEYRKQTYVYLLGEANGLNLLSVYFQQASLTDISKDIKLMCKLLDGRKK